MSFFFSGICLVWVGFILFKKEIPILDNTKKLLYNMGILSDFYDFYDGTPYKKCTEEKFSEEKTKEEKTKELHKMSLSIIQKQKDMKIHHNILQQVHESIVTDFEEEEKQQSLFSYLKNWFVVDNPVYYSDDEECLLK